MTFTPNKKDPFQNLMLSMLGAVAELERNLILERQREGIALAKLKGKYKGGQHKLTNEQAEEIKTLVNNRTPIPLQRLIILLHYTSLNLKLKKSFPLNKESLHLQNMI